MERAYRSSAMETGQIKEKAMIGSMFVGLLIGLLAGAITNRGERMGCFGKMFLGWIGAFLGQLLFGSWGGRLKRYSYYPSSSRCHDCLSYLLGKRKLASRL